MATDGEPAADLPIVFFRHSSAHKVATVPLKPSARISGVDPTFFPPDRERLACIHAEAVECGVMFFVAELGVSEPVTRKFLTTVGHVLSSEDTECQHLFRRQVGRKALVEVLAHRFSQRICRGLHRILYVDNAWFWRRDFHGYTLALNDRGHDAEILGVQDL